MVWGSSPGRDWEFFSSQSCPDRLWGPPTHPLIQWVPGALSLVVKRPGRKTDHSPPSSAEVKMRGAIPPLPQYALMMWCSVKAQGQHYLYFNLRFGWTPQTGDRPTTKPLLTYDTETHWNPSTSSTRSWSSNALSALDSWSL
jgi:hypothetical protein